MAKSYSIERYEGSASYELPPEYCDAIGRLIVRWAYFEFIVQEMVWGALNLRPATGRIAVREPRVTDRLEMLNELIKERGARWDNDLYKSILTQARLLTAKRDLVAHGIWYHVKDKDEWHVQLARGSWPKNLAALVARSKRVTPESVLMDVEMLKAATKEISDLIEDMKTLRGTAQDD